MSSATPNPSVVTRRLRALSHADVSLRLSAAMAAGTHPDPAHLEVLVERSRVEPDVFVRDMLVWAIIQLPTALTVPRLVAELADPRPQARAQALHALSKIGDPSAWPSITPDLFGDPDLQVARTAWRAAVALVPAGEEESLAARLVQHLGRGDREVQRSLSRSLVGLGEVVRPLLAAAADGTVESVRVTDPMLVRAHARATVRLLDDPEVSFTYAIDEADRWAAQGFVEE